MGPPAICEEKKSKGERNLMYRVNANTRKELTREGWKERRYAINNNDDNNKGGATSRELREGRRGDVQD